MGEIPAGPQRRARVVLAAAAGRPGEVQPVVRPARAPGEETRRVELLAPVRRVPAWLEAAVEQAPRAAAKQDVRAAQGATPRQGPPDRIATAVRGARGALAVKLPSRWRSCRPTTCP